MGALAASGCPPHILLWAVCLLGPWSQSQSVSFYSLTGNSRRAGPTPTTSQHSLSLLHYGQSLPGVAVCPLHPQLTWATLELCSCAAPSWASSCSKVRGARHFPSAIPLLGLEPWLTTSSGQDPTYTHRDTHNLPIQGSTQGAEILDSDWVGYYQVGVKI